MLYTDASGMNKDEVYDDNPTNYEHKHKFLANVLFPGTGTKLFWNETYKSLHLSHISQLNRLKFQIQNEQMRNNPHIHTLVSHWCNFHKILPYTCEDGKISQQYYERTYKSLQERKSSSLIYSYWDIGHCGMFQVYVFYLFIHRGTLDISSSYGSLMDLKSIFRFWRRQGPSKNWRPFRLK